MTNQDWTRFCEMMAAAGWRIRRGIGPWFYFVRGEFAYHTDGSMWRRGKLSQAGNWREWLAKGQTPPPF